MILSHIKTVQTAAKCAASLSPRRIVLRQLSKFGLLSGTSAGSNTDGSFVAPSNDALGYSRYVQYNDWMIVNNELEGIRKNDAVI